jgi:dCMP deaminase
MILNRYEKYVNGSQKMTDWDRYYFKIVDAVKEKSKDLDTKVGCIIVGPEGEIRSTGYNGFCRHVDDTAERWSKPSKYWWVEHAERNAVYNAARMGISLNDCRAYVQISPCVHCARALIQAGIEVICVPKVNHMARYEELQTRMSPEEYRKNLEEMNDILTMIYEAGCLMILLE